jgi:hypothetical protein
MKASLFDVGNVTPTTISTRTTSNTRGKKCGSKSPTSSKVGPSKSTPTPSSQISLSSQVVHAEKSGKDGSSRGIHISPPSESGARHLIRVSQIRSQFFHLLRLLIHSRLVPSLSPFPLLPPTKPQTFLLPS